MALQNQARDAFHRVGPLTRTKHEHMLRSSRRGTALNPILRTIRQAASRATAVHCDETGLTVAGVALLANVSEPSAPCAWQPRPVSDLNTELSDLYGVSIELDGKLQMLCKVAGALNAGDVGGAQILSIRLAFPAPLRPTNVAPSVTDTVDLAKQLLSAGLLKVEWDASKHPRWPAGATSGVGGQFAPVNSGQPSGGGEHTGNLRAQIAIPFPGAIEFPEWLQIPGIRGPLFPPLIGPTITPREVPKNPYPDRPECAEEWRHAEEYCDRLRRNGKLGKDGHRGMGTWYYQCLMGQVSEGCGGNPLTS